DIDQPAGINIDGVQLRQRVDHCFAYAPAQSQVLAYLGWSVASDDQPTPALHQVKGRANDACILAQEVWPGGKVKYRVYRREQPVLAGHVVCCRSNRSERRPAEDKFVRSVPNQVGEIGMASGELLDFNVGLRNKALVLHRIRQMCAQIAVQ